MSNFWARFNKRWSATGTTAEPTDLQQDTGFSYLGANAPSVELFNALFQNLDEKDNWLYARIVEVLAAGGITPSEATPAQLLPALRALFQPGFAAFGTSQSFIIPAGVTRVKVRAWGGGGGGGGSYGPISAGSGGGGGGYTEGIHTVSPGASVFITVGAGGAGSASLSVNSAAAGGTSSFGSFCSASGGGPGTGGTNVISATGSTAGMGTGGTLNLGGSGGGFGQRYVGDATGGGQGGHSPFGGGISTLSIGGAGNGGLYPGGGATGGGMRAGAGGADSFQGGRGADGLVIVEW